MKTPKKEVRDFWDTASCGENLYLPQTDRDGYLWHAKKRYQLEPYIADLARFEETRGKKVLEIGVGLGADHAPFAEGGAVLSGIDLTERAIEHTRRRLEMFGFQSRLAVGDAEQLDYPDASFDNVYSWGVLHHSPDTPRAVEEVFRVLKPGGKAAVMIYHKWSLVGIMLWTRYAALRLKPLTSLAEIYGQYLESPGTKAYSIAEARRLFAKFSDVRISIKLSHGDLLESEAGQRHKGRLLAVARVLWPRRVLRALFPRLGLFMLIEARR